MIEGRIIICLASSWDYDPTSKHQIMKILARHNDVVWVNYHGTRRPTFSRADFQASCSVLRRFLGGITRVTPTMTQITPLVIPGATGPILSRVHQRMLIAQIRRAIRSVPNARNKPRQVWSFAPDVPYLAGKFNEECFLYYCVDEHSQFEGVDEQAILRAENELIDRADIVVTTSEALRKAKSVRRPDVSLVRHGVDFDHFAAAWRKPLTCPADLASVPRPIFGFFGLIHFWIDCALIARVARLRPEYSFVLIGDCKRDVSTLERLPNVFLLGRRSIDVLPPVLRGLRRRTAPLRGQPADTNGQPDQDARVLGRRIADRIHPAAGGGALPGTDYYRGHRPAFRRGVRPGAGHRLPGTPAGNKQGRGKGIVATQGRTPLRDDRNANPIIGAGGLDADQSGPSGGPTRPQFRTRTPVAGRSPRLRAASARVEYVKCGTCTTQRRLRDLTMKHAAIWSAAVATAALAGCGSLIDVEFSNRLVGTDGQLFSVEDLTNIAEDADLSEDGKRQEFRDLGIEDEELINALLDL